MAFDMSTARPVRVGGFDPASARPVQPDATQQPPPAAEPSFFDQLRQSYGNQVQDAWNTISQNPGAAAMETVGAVNRAAMAIPDMPINLINAISRANEQHGIGSGGQLPTITDTVARATGAGAQGYLPEGPGRNAAQAAGNFVAGAAGVVPVARVAGAPSSMAADFAGIGSTQTPFLPGLPAPFTPDLPYVSTAPISESQKQLQNLSAGNPHPNTAGVMISPVTGKVITDPVGKKASTQGFDPGLVAWIKTSTEATRRKMLQMLDIVDRGKANFREAGDNRPLNVVGDSVLNRIKVVQEANRVAAVRLDDVAKGLVGESVDINPAMSKFVDSLTEMGMKYDPQTNTLELIQGSATQDMPKVQKEAMRILRRLQTTRETGKLDAFDVHTMKKWIDNNVDYAKTGKGKSGMIGSLDRAIKGLRHDLDSTLDEQFDAYNNVNTQYAETRQALDDVYDIAGSRFNPNADSAAVTIGSLSRRFLSNAQSNGYLRDSISNLDTVARKYIKPGTDLVPYKPIQHRSGVTPDMLENDDLVGLVMFSDELDKTFGAASRTSLLGDVQKGVGNAVIDASLGQKTAAGMTAEAGKWAYNKARGVSEANASKAMRELLQRGQ